MRFVGLALISALAASGATWGCQNAPPPSSSAGEVPAIPAPAAAQAPSATIAAGAAVTSPTGASANSAGASQAEAPEGAPDAVRGRAPSAGEAAPVRVTRVALQGDDSRSNELKSNAGLLAAGDQRLTGEGLSEDRLLQDPLIGDTLIGDGEPMDDVDDAASGVSEPDPDQAGAPNEPSSIPRPMGPGAGQAEPRGTAPENQQR